MNLDRRHLLAALASLGLPLPGIAQAAVLPLRTPGLDHLDVMVPDVEKAARFYMAVFRTTLHAQPFQGAFRYFVLLGELNDKREVGYLAIGDSTGRGRGPAYIGHFCTSVSEWRRDSEAIFAEMGSAFAAAGFGEFPGSTGVGGIFTDPDGIEIQFLPAPDTLVTAAEPSDLVAAGQGLVTPLGVDHVLLHVSDLASAVRYYEVLYGKASRRDGDGRVFFDFPASTTSLQLEQARYEYGQRPRIAHFAIKVRPFELSAVEAGLMALGATLESAEERGVLRFRDPDGIVVELRPTA